MVHRARTHLPCRRRRSCSVSTGLPPSRRRPAGSRAPLMVNVMGDVVGGDTTKNFWLPIEVAYLASRTSGELLPVPAAEYELAVLVLRMVLKHSTWDAILQARGSLSASERRELAWLSARAEWPAVDV